MDMSKNLRLDITNNKLYCGPVYVHAVLDKESEIAEPREDRHHLVSKTMIYCDGGSGRFSTVSYLMEILNE